MRHAVAMLATLAALAAPTALIPAPAEAAHAPAPPAAYPEVGRGTAFLDHDALVSGYAEPEWYKANIPFLEVPDREIQDVYYYRWSTYKRHIRYTDSATGDVITEFHNPPGYSAPLGGIVAAAGHHVYEGRWLRDTRPIDDYLTYWLQGPGSRPQAEGGVPQQGHRRLGAPVRLVGGRRRLPALSGHRRRVLRQGAAARPGAAVRQVGRPVRQEAGPLLVGAGVGRDGVHRLVLRDRPGRSLPRRRGLPADAERLPVRRRQGDRRHRHLERRQGAGQDVRTAGGVAAGRAAPLSVGPEAVILLPQGPRRPGPPGAAGVHPRGDRFRPVGVRHGQARYGEGVGAAARPAGVRRAVRADHRRTAQPAVHARRAERLLPLGRAELALLHLDHAHRDGQPARRLRPARGHRRRLLHGAARLRAHPVQGRAPVRRRGAPPRRAALDLRRRGPQ